MTASYRLLLETNFWPISTKVALDFNQMWSPSDPLLVLLAAAVVVEF
jgi:hypothetical protein